MFVTELDTFVLKFHQLWNAGYNAHLDLDTHAGYAWVGLRVQLGQAPGPLHHRAPPPPFAYNQKKAESQSRQRRRARRSAERQAAAEEAPSVKEAAKAYDLQDTTHKEHYEEREVIETVDNEEMSKKQNDMKMRMSLLKMTLTLLKKLMLKFH